MIITQIEGKNFRNYKTFSFSPSPNFNFLFGDNGQGKTTILEALHCALRGKSFKPFVRDQFIKNQEKEAWVRLFLQEDEGQSEITASFLKEEQKKQIKYCGRPVGRSFLEKKVYLSVFTEEKMKVIRQGPETRRDFVDHFLIEDGERPLFITFNKLLKEKQKLLRGYKKELISKEEMEGVLQVLEPRFLESSLQVTKRRLQILKETFKRASSLASSFFRQTSVKLNFKYQIHSKDPAPYRTEEELLFQVEQDLKDKRNKEIQLGLSLSGPHKHDLLFLFNDHNSRIFCSQGQQRSYLLTLFGGRIKNRQKGLLFLDDVLMELDDFHQEKFLSFLSETPCQIFLTHYKKNTKKHKNISSFCVKNEIISPYYEG